MQVGIDVGGTYTDAVLISEGKVAGTVKIPTDSRNLLDSVLTALDELLQVASAQDIERVALSTTL